MWIDAHCHLDSENVPNGPELVIARALDAGVDLMVAVGVGRFGAALKEVRALAEANDKIWFSAGIHPHDAKDARDEEKALIAEALTHPRCVALGEVGLDYYYDNSPKEEQRALFAEMIALGHRAKKPLMLHVRNAHDDALQMLRAAHDPNGRNGVVHCFTEGPDIARAYLELGFYLSIPGIVTFKTAQALVDAVAIAPRDRVIVETDSPYLAPIPMRGKKNEPSFLPYTGRKIAEIWGISEEEVARITSDNAKRLFGLGGEASGW